MFEFYEFNQLNICILSIATFLIYYILTKVLNKESSEQENAEFKFDYFIIAIILAVTISLIVAYIMTNKDESLLTEKYWDNADTLRE
jgi:hydrogenase-4 membrane subunit HyfE